jgi:hypothetical protein
LTAVRQASSGDLQVRREDAVCIGASGHRFLTEQDRLRAGINVALDRIQSRFPNRRIVVVSSLAEGADRLIAQEALRRAGATLVVPLPLPPSDYIKDFVDQTSQGEFASLLTQAVQVIALPPASSRSEAYQAAGRFIVEGCDVLLTVWDGLDEQGPGGTAVVVAAARDRRLPLAWVHAGNRRTGTDEPTTLGEEQGAVTYENLPDDSRHPIR